MRKIELADRPNQLTDDEVERLTSLYKKTGQSVWRKSYIIDALLKMTYNKCSYSEAKLQEGGAYMEVDHFHPKSKYPEEVVKWGNLLPACKTCNVKKGDVDTMTVPMINPLVDDPKLYLRFVGPVCQVAQATAPKELQIKAKNSIFYYDLNSMQFITQRSSIILANDQELGRLKEEIDEGALDEAPSRKRWMARFCAILMSAQPTEPYSTCIAQALKDNFDFRYIRKQLESKNLLTEKINRLLSNLS